VRALKYPTTAQVKLKKRPPGLNLETLAPAPSISAFTARVMLVSFDPCGIFSRDFVRSLRCRWWVAIQSERSHKRSEYPNLLSNPGLPGRVRGWPRLMAPGVRNWTHLSVVARGLGNELESPCGVKFSRRMQSGQHDYGALRGNKLLQRFLHGARVGCHRIQHARAATVFSVKVVLIVRSSGDPDRPSSIPHHVVVAAFTHLVVADAVLVTREYAARPTEKIHGHAGTVGDTQRASLTCRTRPSRH
jgi:hypothetical protein